MRRTAALAMACVVGVVNAAYDENLATKALYYSGAAYCRKDTIYDWTCGEPCSSLPGAGNVFKVENELLDLLASLPTTLLMIRSLLPSEEPMVLTSLTG